MLRIRLLGELALERDGVALELPASRPARALLGWLALHPGAHGRARVAALLWPDVLDSSARASLRTALHALRGALGGDGAGAIAATREELGLADDVWVDVRAFAELAAAGRLEAAFALAGGELLSGLDDDWVLAARERHRAAVARVLEQLAAQAEAGGDHRAAVRWTRALVDLDALSEEANRALIARLWRAGDRSSAVAVYERLSERLRSELRIAPSAQTRALLKRLRDEPPAPGDQRLPRPDLPPALARRRRSAFVGRAPELARLSAALDAVRAGERRLVAISGQPGIGKTRLVREFGHSAHAGGAVVLFGRCIEEPLHPYGAFVEALRPFAAHLPPELTAGGGAATVEAPDGGARWRLFEAIDELLAAIAREGPALLLLDDLQWAGAPTLALLAHLLRSPRPVPLLVVATHRSSEVGRVHPLAALLSDLDREELVDRITLGGLDRSQIAALAAGRLDGAGVEELARTLHDDTAGNPFFVEELLRHLAESGALRPVPETVKDVIAQRLERFDAFGHAVLAAAAVSGRDFDLEVLEALPELAGGEPLRTLEAATAAQMVREDPSRPGRYDFAHALVRETLYEELSDARRARLHGAIARAVEALHRDELDAYAAELAHHHLAAGSARGPEAALTAARSATAKLAYEEAALWCERALAQSERSGAATARRNGELLLALGRARQRAGDGPAAREAFERAAAIARTLGDGELLGHAALGFSGLGVTIIAVDEAAVSLLREALDAAPADAALATRLVARLAVQTYYVSTPDERRELGDRAVARGRAGADHGALLDALDARHVALWTAAHLDERLAIAEEMIALARRVGDRERELQGRNWRVLNLAERGDIAAMKQEIERHEELADELALAGYQWWGPMWRATIALLEGRIDDCERLIGQITTLGAHAHDANAMLYAELQSYGLTLEREQFGALGEEVLHRQRGRPAEPAYRCGYAWVYAGQGRAEQSLAQIDWVAEDDFARLPEDMNRLASLCELAQAAALLGDRRHARGIYLRLAPYAGRNVVNARAAAGYGAAAHHLALLAELLGDDDRGAAHFEDALEHNARMGARPWLARTQLCFARLLRARGEAARAGELVERAVAIAEGLDHAPLTRRARAAQAEAAKRVSPGSAHRR